MMIKQKDKEIFNNISEEFEKCKKSPYYFCYNYLRIKDKHGNWIPYITELNEDEFNKLFNRLTNTKSNEIRINRNNTNSCRRYT